MPTCYIWYVREKDAAYSYPEAFAKLSNDGEWFEIRDNKGDTIAWHKTNAVDHIEVK